MEKMETAETVVSQLFDRLLNHPQDLPAEWGAQMDRLTPDKRARRVADYLSGMTDTYALREYGRLFDDLPALG